ncbi:MAG: hypothetical protein IPI78_05015 [Chitinophagaceae bacterium]|nr:hypothetical protein [Chitinophagaceae bacterium]
MYPNPEENGYTTLNFKTQYAGNAQLHLLNAMGQQLFQKSITVNAGTSNIVPLELKTLSKGLLYHFMKNRLFFITASFLLLFAVVGNAQIKIGNNPTTIGASSLLELESTTKGIVFPRLTGAQMIAIPSPVAGMQIYNTDSSCVCQYNGTAWRSLCGGNTGSPYLDWHILGNSGTSAATNFIGTIDAIDFVTRTGNTERMRVMPRGVLYRSSKPFCKV